MMSAQQEDQTGAGPIESDVPTDNGVLLFRLDEETFGPPVAAVGEIIDPQRVTPVPNAGPFAPGLINVRGTIVPLLDVRSRLRMSPPTDSPTARMIVFEAADSEGEPERIAFLADAVERVVERADAALDPVPELGANWPADCVAGSFRNDDQLVICLEPAALFAPEARPDPGKGTPS